jgi:ABC-type antimicrobial peptide transport system ATPase subunit
LQALTGFGLIRWFGSKKETLHGKRNLAGIIKVTSGTFFDKQQAAYDHSQKIQIRQISLFFVDLAYLKNNTPCLDHRK